MANHQTNFTSNFGEMGETGNAAFVLNVNGTSHTYHPVGSDVSVDVATVRRILATGPNLAQSIASVLAADGYPILVYDGSEYGYIKTVNSRYVFTCLDSLNGVKQAEVDIRDGTITAGTGSVNGVVILARTDSDLFLKITTAITLGRMPIISDTGVYYQLIAKTSTIAQFGRITGTGALEVLTVNNSDQITSSSFVFVQDPYYVHTDNNFTNTDKSNVDANTNARHTHTNKSVLDDIEQSNIDNWDNKLNPTGDASDTTVTFTKASGDTSSTVSGSKLSVIFTAISSFFASFKALAFKDKASYNDLSSGVQSSLDKADTALQRHQSVTDNNPTLAWGTTSTVGTVGGTSLQITMPSNPASGKADKASITGATKCKITYNSQGIVTAGAGLSASDIPNLAASKIASGQFGTDRIADDAITAAKVKDNETLPVNVSGNARYVRQFLIDKGSQTTNVWAKVATASVSAWNGYSIAFQIGFNGYANGASYAAEISVGYQAGNGGAYAAHQLYVYRRNYSGTSEIDAKLVRNDNTLELWVKDGITDTALFLVPVYMRGFSVNYADSNDRTKQLTDAAFTTYIADKTKYDAVVRTTAFIPGFSQVGSPSNPVYVDSNGKVKPCDSIDLGAPKHSATITSGAGVVYYTSPADTFAIAINYDRANSRAYITVNNTTSGRQLYVSLGHSNNLTPVAYADNVVIVGTASEYNLFDLDILCMGIGDEMPVFSFTIGIQVNESRCTYTIYDRMKYHL